jgi:hypothetical protein
VAVNDCIAPVTTFAVVVDKVTAIAVGAAATVIVADADFVPSATEVAVSVTVAGLGTFAGAVYVIGVPEALAAADSVPQVAPVHPAAESDQLTPLLAESFVTVAVKA